MTTLSLPIIMSLVNFARTNQYGRLQWLWPIKINRHQSYQWIKSSTLKLHRNNLFERISLFKNESAYADKNIDLEITF